MAPIMDFTVSDSSIGLVVRPMRRGPEADLILRFVDAETHSLRGKRRSYAVFQEPQLDTGFPDIVVVGFDPRVFDRWHRDRDHLTTVDLKVIQHLHLVGGADADQIEVQLGLDSKVLVRSLERLLAAGLVRWAARHWVPRSLRSAYGISSIQAIEAKMRNWRDALEQAEMNRWFASESYVLSPIQKPTDRVVAASQSLGVGIYTMPAGTAPKRLTRAKKTPLPACYASWLFNEWIGRRLGR